VTAPPRFSVVLPTRDRPRRLEAAAQSVLEQAREVDLELWIVDDASGLETAVACGRLARDRRVHVLRNPSSLGAAAARNLGARHASGEYLAFIDDDCVWHPDRLTLIHRALEKDPTLEYLCTQTVVIHPPPSLRYDIDPVLDRQEPPWRVGTPMITVSREAFLEVGGFDERLPRAHDWDLAVRLVDRATWGFLAEPLAWADGVAGLTEDPAKLVRASRVLAAKHGRRSPLSRGLAVEFHTAFGHKLLARGHWIEGLRHFAIAAGLAPGRLRGWLYLGAAVPGPRAYDRLARLARRGPARRGPGPGNGHTRAAR
jgi:glycosyltransferase involved in cell wall biosynthesis